MADKLFWNILKLRNWDKNPRAIKSDKFQELKNRINKYGQFKPVITTIDGEVIGGNMRLRAMKDLGIQDIWVSVVEPKTEAEKIEIALADNEEMGYYQEDQLAELISSYKDEIKLDSFSIHLGDGVNLDDLLNKYQPEEVVEDEAPEVEEEAISELGAIYKLGKHRLMCGDSTNIEQVEQLMDGNKADMVFTDPPYGMNLDTDYSKLPSTKKEGNKKYNKIIGDNQQFNYQNFKWIKCEEQIWFGANYYAKTLDDTGSWLVWDKRVEDKFDKMFGSGFELAWSKKPHKQKIYRHNNTLFGGDTEARGKEHPTQKPTKLIVEILNDLGKHIKIMDLFGGSGSTLIACEQTDRQCYMMELDPRYVDVIRKRYAKFIGKENEWQEVTPRIN